MLHSQCMDFSVPRLVVRLWDLYYRKFIPPIVEFVTDAVPLRSRIAVGAGAAGTGERPARCRGGDLPAGARSAPPSPGRAAGAGAGAPFSRTARGRGARFQCARVAGADDRRTLAE